MLADYDKAIALNSHIAATYGNRCLAGEDEGDMDSAVADYSKAIEIFTKVAKIDPRLDIAFFASGSDISVAGQ